MTRHLVVWLCSATLAFAAQPGGLNTPESVLALVKQKGARAAILSLWNTPQWNTLIVGLSHGETGWMQVAEEIRPGSDAGAMSELTDAMAWALPHASEQVLARSKYNAIWRDTCDGPPVDFPPQGAVAYFKEAIAAVGRVTNPSLRAVRDDCLHRLKSAAASGTK